MNFKKAQTPIRFKDTTVYLAGYSIGNGLYIHRSVLSRCLVKSNHWTLSNSFGYSLARCSAPMSRKAFAKAVAPMLMFKRAFDTDHKDNVPEAALAARNEVITSSEIY